MEALKLDPDNHALRAAHLKAIEALRELANTLDDHAKPSGNIDSMRRDVYASMARHCTANDNDQPTRRHG